MKKMIFATALALAASASFAQMTAFVDAEYSRLAGGDSTIQEAAFGLASTTRVGTFDAAVVGNRYKFGGNNETVGFELGFSNGFKLGASTITGRVSYGRKNQTQVGNVEYYGVGAELVAPLVGSVNGVVGYRFRNTMGSPVNLAENRFTAGVEVPLSKSFAVRGGYSHMVANGQNFNGVTATALYKF